MPEYVLGNKAKELYRYTKEVIVSEITGVTCEARPPIRAGKYDKAKDAVRKVNRQRRRPPENAQQKVPTGFPW